MEDLRSYPQLDGGTRSLFQINGERPALIKVFGDFGTRLKCCVESSSDDEDSSSSGSDEEDSDSDDEGSGREDDGSD